MKNIKNKIISVFAALFIWGCGAGAPAEPHVFVSSYEPLGDEFFSEYENSAKAIYSVTGSGFLRQRGGGIINCAGNEVKAVPVMPSSNYVNEVNSLSWRVQAVTALDPQYLADKERLEAISAIGYCDVQGYFELTGLTPGSYTLGTTISWEVAQICGYGSYTYACTSNQGGYRTVPLTIADNPDKTEYKAIITQ